MSKTRWEITWGVYRVHRDDGNNETAWTRVKDGTVHDFETQTGYGYRFPGGSQFAGFEGDKATCARMILEHHYKLFEARELTAAHRFDMRALAAIVEEDSE